MRAVRVLQISIRSVSLGVVVACRVDIPSHWRRGPEHVHGAHDCRKCQFLEAAQIVGGRAGGDVEVVKKLSMKPGVESQRLGENSLLPERLVVAALGGPLVVSADHGVVMTRVGLSLDWMHACSFMYEPLGRAWRGLGTYVFTWNCCCLTFPIHLHKQTNNTSHHCNHGSSQGPASRCRLRHQAHCCRARQGRRPGHRW